MTPTFRGKKPHDTYLHAFGGQGWPADHRAEDTFEVPGAGWLTNAEAAATQAQLWEPAKNKTTLEATHVLADAPQYSAAYTGSGKVILVLSTPDRTIGYFDTFADAQLAAEALNNHKGY